ncbi:SDR family oxidoreductase [Chloroflexia bacterium SDU3-3]|nr:SDR family oxidoreductase [Chloroflexia bacterium SDU3-3]
MHLQGRVALITGAGSGLGAAAARLLAQHGAKVAALGRTADELEKVVGAITSEGGTAKAFVADVSDAESMRAAADQVAREWGTIDIVFANAGVNGVWAPLDELSPEEFEKTIKINLTGTFLTIKYAAPYLKKQGGSVIVTASINGTRVFSNTGATAYSASKAGQVAITKMLALELARDKVRVNVICPGAIKTEIDQNTERRDLDEVKVPVEFPEGNIPLTHGQPGTSEQVAELVLFLASDASSHISGTELWIDGTQSLLVG